MAQAKTRAKINKTSTKVGKSARKQAVTPDEATSAIDTQPETEVDVKKVGKMHETVEDHGEDFVADVKSDDEIVAPGDEEEDPLAEDATLDEEELNPFGDKWEL